MGCELTLEGHISELVLKRLNRNKLLSHWSCPRMMMLALCGIQEMTSSSLVPIFLYFLSLKWNRNGRGHCMCWIWWQINNNTIYLYLDMQLSRPGILSFHSYLLKWFAKLFSPQIRAEKLKKAEQFCIEAWNFSSSTKSNIMTSFLEVLCMERGKKVCYDQKTFWSQKSLG